MTKSKGILPPRRAWTPEEVNVLRELYPNVTAVDVADRLGRTVEQVYTKAHLLGLKKSEDFFADPRSGRLVPGSEKVAKSRSTRFKKGLVPWNKGVKGLSLGGSETRFKPGNRSGRAVEVYQPIGTEIVRGGYLARKVNDDAPFYKRWRAVHILNWEAVNGPLPQGHALVFRDGDRQNVSVENLELVTRSELMRRNSFHQYGPEIAEVIRLRGAVTRQINKKEGKSK